MQIQLKKTWMTSIQEYLATRAKPEEKKERRKLKNEAARYTIIEGELYKRSFTMPYLKCLGEKEAEYALRKLYKGICGNYLGAKTIAHNLI